MRILPSRRSMRGQIVWAMLLLATGVTGMLIFRGFTPKADRPLTAEETAMLDSFNQAVALDSAARRKAWENRFPLYGKQNAAEPIDKERNKFHPRPVETFPFDPNHADSITFLRLGLRPWQAHNALQFRRKGGVWRNAEHFSKLYGLNEEDFRRLAPYIRIDSVAVKSKNRAQSNGNEAELNDVNDVPRQPKYAPGSVQIDLNNCDTTELQRIPKIGSYRARLIVQYREQLGGFTNIAQLREIQGLPQGIETWFSVDASATTKTLNANEASFQSLVRHPYLSYEQVREIMNYRTRFGRLSSLDDLRLSPHFTSDDLQRLKPYLTF